MRSLSTQRAARFLHLCFILGVALRKDALKKVRWQAVRNLEFGLQLDFDLWQDADMADNKKPSKNPAAVALGRLGGLKGGPARTASMTSAQRKAAARKAAQARWSKRKKEA
jgi:hypothetical protein